MANVVTPPITDPTGQLILNKLLELKRNIHLPLGEGLLLNNSTNKYDVIPDIYSGTGYPDRMLGKVGDIYVRYKWISREEQPTYAADIHTLYTKLPIGSIEQEDPSYNSWTEIISNFIAYSGTEEPLPEMGSNGDLYFMYTEIVDPGSLTPYIQIYRIYQKIEGIWGYIEAGVPRAEYEQGVYEARYKSLVVYNKDRLILFNTVSDKYTEYLILDQDFNQESRSALNFDFEIHMNVVCTPYETFSRSLKMGDDTKIRISYEFDRERFPYYPEQVLEDGPNVLSIHYPVKAVDSTIHNFKIYFEVMNGTITIESKGLIGNISGTGVDAEGFNGVMVGSDNISVLNFFNSTLFASIEDSKTDSVIVPITTTDGHSESINGITFSSAIRSFSDNLISVDLEEPEEEEEDA